MTDPKQPLEHVPHSNGSNSSFLTPEAREEIEAVKDRIRAGDREGVNNDTQEALDKVSQTLQDNYGGI